MIKTRLIKLLSHAKIYIALQVVCQWFSLLAQVVTVYASVTLLEAALLEAFSKNFVAVRAMMIAAAILLRFFFERQNVRCSYLASVDVKTILRQKIYEKLLRLGPAYREQTATSELVQLAGEGVEQLETYFGKYLPQFFYSLLAPLTLFAILAFVNVKASVILLICVPLIPVSIVVVQKIAKRLLNKYWGIYTELGDSFLENLQGLTTLKIYQADEKKAQEMDEESQRFRRITMKVLTMQLNSTSVMDIIAYGGAAIGMVVTISEYVKGNLGLAGALMIILLSAEFFIPLRLLGSFFHIAMNGMAASDRIFAFLDLPEPEEKAGMLQDGPVEIRMEHVDFAYDEDRTILQDVCLLAKAGGLTSIVGASGSGKSTIARILTGRNRGYTGSVRLQGMELSEVNSRSLASHITLVSHESYIFKGTVRDNLRMGKMDASEEEMRDALAAVNLLSFLETQKGLDTELTEQGGNFSGGQRQRLALARALLQDSPVYIFDEATSNIDAQSEALIMDVIRSLAETKTVLLISHRLANVVGSDRIYAMQGGAIAESGTHEDLLARGGEYSRMYRYQKELEAFAGGPEEKQAADTSFTEQCAARQEPASDTVETAGKTAGVWAAGDAPAGDGLAPQAAETGAARRSGLAIMGQLITLIRPLLPVMLLAIVLGVIGYLCAISLTILAGYGIVHGLLEGLGADAAAAGGLTGFALKSLFAMMITFAVARGFLHYGEQYCNHFIAFKLLAIIRHQVFAALRKLCPAKLEGKDRGNLISIITSDIELLEVFYAHTISPIAIAVLVCLVMTVLIGLQHPAAALIAALGYLVVGVLIPLWNGRRNAGAGMRYRSGFGELSGFVLDSLRGLDETLQYGQGQERLSEMTERSKALGKVQEELNRYERMQRPLTNLAISLFSAGMLFFMLRAFSAGRVDFSHALIAVVAMMGSFGPAAALSNLSATLSQTLASGERVLRLLEETPQVEEVTGRGEVSFAGAEVQNIRFSYGRETILQDISLRIPKDKIIGIHGESGCGKSTLLKLLMRFWDVGEGAVEISGTDIKEINTGNLRAMEAYVTQETSLFHDTIANNIAIGRPAAAREEIVEAAKKAALDAFIRTLPEGYDTMVGELGSTLSGGERQRIGIARAFLHDAPFLLLDEPTSNLDALNEGIIMKSIADSATGRTVVLVSHRRSTLNMADQVISLGQGRRS